MTSIVLDLQKEAMNSTLKVSDLLRKAYVVAKKLGTSEFEKWIRSELDGPEGSFDDMPPYRKVKGEVVASNLHYGWRPVMFGNEDIANLVSQNFVNTSVAEIELLCEQVGNFLQITLPPSIEDQLNRFSTGPLTQFRFQFPLTQAHSILDAVRNIVLDWSLKLESDGILGDDISFSEGEKRLAEDKSYVVNYNFHGDIRDTQFQQNHASGSQVKNSGLNLEEVRELLILLLQEKVNLPNAIHPSIDQLEEELQKAKPDLGVVRKTLCGLKSLLGNVTGSLMASGLLRGVEQLL